MTAADWLKFLPGWFAAVVAAWTLFDKWQTRRHRRALGPDDIALRTDLTTLRRLFMEIQEEDRREDWFKADERRDLGHRLLDHSSRRSDLILTEHVSTTAIAWHYVRFHASSAQDPGLRLEGEELTEQEQAYFRWQRKAAAQGLKAIEAALKRLNELERRTFGR